jgi:hypothetical protein
VHVARQGHVFQYRLEPEPDDRREAPRQFRGVAEEAVRLVRDTWRVELPRVFSEVHPDLHAAALLHTLRPFVGLRLRLPFGVSTALAEIIAREEQVELTPVDPARAPRQAPERPRPTVLFSGGMDSMATALLMPPGSLALYLDRIVTDAARATPVRADSVALVDLVPARRAARAVQRFGHDVQVIRDDHEGLMTPYPTWHSEMSLLLPCYLADTFDVQAYETGDVLGVFHMHGYHDGSTERWGFRRGPAPRQPSGPGPAGGAPGGQPPPATDRLGVLGLDKVCFTAGLSEVATARVVGHSPLRGRSWSCYHRAPGASFCLMCDKCFKKVMLLAIVDDADFPAETFDRFMALPRLAAIFTRPFFDWHHIWFYVFQRIRCRHPFVAELQRQAQQGPDLRLLERWYPACRDAIPAAYRDAVVANIERTVGILTPAEVQTLEALDVPPLHAPPYRPAP